MRDGDPFGFGLLPAIAIAVGMLGGAGLVRQGTAPARPPAAPAASAETRSPSEAAAKPENSLKDLRPVLELLAEAINVSSDPSDSRELSKSLEAELERPHFFGPLPRPFAAAAIDNEPDANVHRSRRAAARSTSAKDDNDLLNRLIRASQGKPAAGSQTQPPLPRFDLQFLIATVPDYVDSNSGWAADQVLDAVQSAMSRDKFTLERFRLIDWTRRDPTKDTAVANDSRLHERQPGALIFSRVPDPDSQGTGTAVVQLRVVLLVLETPTGGIHSQALERAADLVQRWAAKSAQPTLPTLQVVGPVFSGSIRSLASALNRHVKSFKDIVVITGSANADSNAAVMGQFAPGVTFRSTLHPTLQVRTARQDFFEKRGLPSGDKAALLIESNTAYGAGAGEAAIQPPSVSSSGQVRANPPSDGAQRNDRNTDLERLFRFPLHIAELLNDAAPSAATVPLLPSTAAPLVFRETVPPSDQIPVLRPQMTSALVAATMSGILDAVRHEGIRTVGIVATDERDVLFLAREVKRAAPDVQLFISGAHVLYLHPDYMPYLRGAIVVSTYPLSLSAQKTSEQNATERLAFPSMSAEGVFNAVRAQMWIAGQVASHTLSPQNLSVVESGDLLDYCAPDASPAQDGCTPPIWLSVIGDDGFWPVATFPEKQATASADRVEPEPTMIRDGGRDRQTIHTAGMPTRTLIVSIVLAAIIVLHLGILLTLGWRIPGSFINRSMSAPVTSAAGVMLHSLSLAVCMTVIGCLAFWQIAVLSAPLSPDRSAGDVAYPILAAALLASIIGLAIFVGVQRRLRHDIHQLPEPNSTTRFAPVLGLGSFLGFAVLIGMVAALASLVGYSWTTYFSTGHAQTTKALDAARTIGGGLVSPAAGILCLTSAIYAPVLWSMRRLALVGNGYTRLAHQSPAFRLLVGNVEEPAANEAKPCPTVDILAHFVDMPLPHLSAPACAVLGGTILVMFVALGNRGATIEGIWFSRFLYYGSLSALVAALLMLAQAHRTWRLLKPKLGRLEQAPIAPALARVGKMSFKWHHSLLPPRLSELVTLVSFAEALRGLILEMTPLTGAFDRRKPDALTVLSANVVTSTAPVRSGDLDRAVTVLVKEETSNLRQQLATEIATHKRASLLESHTWFDLWRLSDALVMLMERAQWSRGERVARQFQTAEPDPDKPGRPTHGPLDQRNSFFETCETLLAFQFGFVLRDIISRVTSALFAVAVTLTLVTTAHLMLVFEGRSSFLMLDLCLIAGAMATSIWVLVGLERDPVISRLRNTTPGKVTFNGRFIGQMVIYGVLPLMVVLASLFPELGESVFRYMQPIRQLANF